MISIEVELPEDKKAELIDFIDFCNEELGVTMPADVIIQNGRGQLTTTAVYNPSTGKVYVNGKDRALIDIMRSVAHEIVHHWQMENNMIKFPVQDAGGPIEDEANAKAGELIKKYAGTLTNTSVIYEQLDRSKTTYKQFIDKAISIWISKGDIDYRLLRRMGAQPFFKNEIDSEEGNEFLNYMVPKLLKALEEDFDFNYEFQIPFEYLYDYFEVRNCDGGNTGHPDVSEVFTKEVEDWFEDCDFIQWDSYIFKTISKNNHELLRGKLKIVGIDEDFLQEEYPDLCHQIVSAYKDAYRKRQANNVRLYVTNSVKNVYSGYKQFKMIVDPTSPQFVVSFPLKEFFKSSTFIQMLNITINDSLTTYLSNIMDYDVGNMVDNSVNCIQGIDELLNLLWEDVNGSITRTQRLINAELNSGHLPVYDCKKLYEGIDGAIDEDFFNDKVRNLILDF